MYDYDAVNRFIEKGCIHPDHWCNGKHIPELTGAKNRDRNYAPDLEKPCNFLKDGICSHPLNPKNGGKA